MGVAGARAVDYGLGRFIGLSACLHLVLLLFAFNLKPSAVPSITFGPVHRVELVSTASLTNARKEATIAERSVALSVPSRHPAISLRKPIDITPAEPLRQIRPVREEPRTTPKVAEELKAKTAASPPAKAAPSGQPGNQALTPPQRPPGESVSAALSEAEISSRMNVYYQIIWESVKSNWTIPAAASLRGNPQATVLLKISPQGRVSQVAFEISSGQRDFDESILRALRKASPFPPLPEWVQGGIEIGIRFRFSDLNTI